MHLASCAPKRFLLLAQKSTFPYSFGALYSKLGLPEHAYWQTVMSLVPTNKWIIQTRTEARENHLRTQEQTYLHGIGPTNSNIKYICVTIEECFFVLENILSLLRFLVVLTLRLASSSSSTLAPPASLKTGLRRGDGPWPPGCKFTWTAGFKLSWLFEVNGDSCGCSPERPRTGGGGGGDGLGNEKKSVTMVCLKPLLTTSVNITKK